MSKNSSSSGGERNWWVMRQIVPIINFTYHYSGNGHTKVAAQQCYVRFAKLVKALEIAARTSVRRLTEITNKDLEIKMRRKAESDRERRCAAPRKRSEERRV